MILSVSKVLCNIGIQTKRNHMFELTVGGGIMNLGDIDIFWRALGLGKGFFACACRLKRIGGFTVTLRTVT